MGEELVERWAENVLWQFFSGMQYYEPRLPCDATQIGRFRRAVGEEGLQQLLKASIEYALNIQAVKPTDLQRVIVDTTVQEKAIAQPVDSGLLEIARHKVVNAAKRLGISLKQTLVTEVKVLRRLAGGYAHAKQFKRLNKAVKRKLDALVAPVPAALSALKTWLERAQRIHTQQRRDKNKLYALHAPEVQCIGKGKARKPYEFGVKVSLGVTHLRGLMVGARRFPANPFDGHTLAAQLEQTNKLMQNLGRVPRQVIVDFV